MGNGPTKATTDLVDARDAECCVRCGRSLASTSGSRHHRQLRRSGDHRPCNLVLLCGSGTTGCHGWVHSKPDEARRVGLIVPSWARPEFVPVLTFRGWRRLIPDGSMLDMTEAQAEQMLEDLGLLA